MLSLVNKGDQTRGLSQENWMNISKDWINENEEESYDNGNFILGLYYVMALAS